MSRFASREPSPDAEWVDAMKHSWTRENGWIHPPFSMLANVLAKIKRDRATATVIAPWWPSQPWFPTKPITFRTSENQPLLIFPNGTRTPAWATLAWRVSGRNYRSTASSRRKFLRSFRNPGKVRPLNNTTVFGKSGPVCRLRKIQEVSRGRLASDVGDTGGKRLRSGKMQVRGVCVYRASDQQRQDRAEDREGSWKM